MRISRLNLPGKKLPVKGLVLFAALLALLAGCGTPAPKTDAAKPVAPAGKDTLMTFLQVQKMEMKANALMQTGNYKLAITEYGKCIAFLDTVLAQGKNKGLCIFGNEISAINLTMQIAYDSLHQPENSVKCIAESMKWAKLTHNYTGEINSDMNIADRLKTLAARASGDTAKKETLCREAIHYSLAGAAVIDSLKTNDIDDLRYAAFHLTSKIYALLGDAKQAQLYDKKYKDVYFKIYKRMPNDRQGPNKKARLTYARRAYCFLNYYITKTI